MGKGYARSLTVVYLSVLLSISQLKSFICGVQGFTSSISSYSSLRRFKFPKEINDSPSFNRFQQKSEGGEVSQKNRGLSPLQSCKGLHKKFNFKDGSSSLLFPKLDIMRRVVGDRCSTIIPPKRGSVVTKSNNQRMHPKITLAYFAKLLQQRLIQAPMAFAATSATTSKMSVTTTTFLCQVKRKILNLTKQRPALLSVIFTIAMIGVSSALLLDIYQTRKRQLVDPTSEWTTYANSPSKRGMELSALIFLKVLPLMALAKILSIVPSRDEDNSNTTNEVDKIKPRSTTKSKLLTKAGSTLAKGLLHLGPLYIKIGQILSCRDNFFPTEFLPCLATLQDRVPAKTGKDAIQLAHESFGGKDKFDNVFVDFDDVPLAAASLGQVHKVGLRDYPGVVVAIKVQRSGLREIYDRDFALMNKIATSVDRFSEMSSKFGTKVGNYKKTILSRKFRSKNSKKSNEGSNDSNPSGGGTGMSMNVGGVQQSWTDIFSDAEEILSREINYRDEAENAIRFASDFGLGINGTEMPCSARSLDGKVLPSAASWMRTPYVYDELSTDKVLVMEYVPSIKVSDMETLELGGVTAEDKEYLAECLARAYLRQFCVNQFFSTDPHPGNLGVEIQPQKQREKSDKGTSNSSRPRLVFYDFGQACSLKKDQAGGILDVIEGIVDSDVEKCVAAFDRMGVLVEGADLDKVRIKVRNNFESGKIKVKERKSMNKGGKVVGNNVPQISNTTDYALKGRSMTKDAVIDDENNGSTKNSVETKVGSSTSKDEDVRDAEIMSFFTLPAEYAFVARAISQMDGVGKGLDAEFDFISASAPFMVEIKGAEKYILDETKKFVSSFGKNVLDWQMDIFKKAGFDPSLYAKQKIK